MTDSKRVTPETLARAIQWVETPVGTTLPPIQPFLERADAIFDALSTPPPSEHVDAAWEALVARLAAVRSYIYDRPAEVVAEHRPIVEAAIRAEGLDALRQIEGECAEWIEYQHGSPDRIITRIAEIARARLGGER